MIDVVMPQLGESVAEGTVTKWLVRVGDFVKREQPLLEVATDKADTEVVAPADGRVAEIRAKEGEIVPKHALLARIDETAARPAAQAPATPSQVVAPGAPPATPTPASAAADESGGRPLSTPSTRKLALESGVDLAGVQPTGERGRVTRDDVIRASAPPSAPAAAPQIIRPSPEPASAPPAPPAPPAIPQELSQLLAAANGYVPPIPGVGYGSYKVPAYVQRQGDEVVPFNRRRRITADHMIYSKHTSPHVLTVAEIDLHATSKLREQHKAQLKKEGVPLTFLVFICAATVKALRKFPQINARVLDNSYALLREVNLGVAVDTPGGLIVPSIKHADQLSLRGLASSLDEMATRARAGKITADDLSGTTFSVSNPGLRGNLFGAAIISQPNVGILRMGEIKKRVVVVSSKDGEDSIAIHPMMYLAFSYDHRVIDGVLANDFLWTIADLLGRGEFEI